MTLLGIVLDHFDDWFELNLNNPGASGAADELQLTPTGEAPDEIAKKLEEFIVDSVLLFDISWR